MKINVGVAFDPDSQMPVQNKMGGHYVVIPKHIALAGFDYERKREAWLEFCRDVHNPNSVVSAELNVKLQKDMDEAHRVLRPLKNIWCIAREGYSLN